MPVEMEAFEKTTTIEMAGFEQTQETIISK